MQVGDSTRLHCKNNIRNTIEKVNSSQFLVLVNCFRSHRIYYWAFILPQDVQLQLKSSPRLYSFNCIIPGDRLLESLRHNISWTWSQVVENHTNNKWCLRRRHERVNHSKEFKNGGYLRWKREYLYFVDNERFRYKHYFTSNCRNMFKYLQIVSLQIVFHKYFL